MFCLSQCSVFPHVHVSAYEVFLHNLLLRIKHDKAYTFRWLELPKNYNSYFLKIFKIKNKKELYFKRWYILVRSPSPIKKPTKHKAQRHKEVFLFKNSNTILLLAFQGVLKSNTNTVISVIPKHQAGPRSENQCPRMESLASWVQGWQVPLSLLGGLLQSQISQHHGQPAHHPILQLSRSWWGFFWPVEFLRQGETEKYVVLL